ncbi:MAG: type III pantothenate kinase [Atopobiaceae bacterium]|jgi:type III pantothenate kinase
MDGQRAQSRTILTVDVGNTTTRLGLFQTGEDAATAVDAAPTSAAAPQPKGTLSLTTPAHITSYEAQVLLETAFQHWHLTGQVYGTALSCVVPSLQEAWETAILDLSQTRSLVVGPGVKTGLKMHYSDPQEIGADRLADCVAAKTCYGVPAVAITLGTSTSFEVIDGSGTFVGGIIAPGIKLGAQSLAAAAAKLPMVDLTMPKAYIGTSTREAMQSGLMFGEAAKISGLLAGICAELGARPTVVISGDGASTISQLISPDHAARIVVDEALTLRGLAILWQKNRR